VTAKTYKTVAKASTNTELTIRTDGPVTMEEMEALLNERLGNPKIFLVERPQVHYKLVSMQEQEE